jgi:quinol monooxygenase YgiN
MLRGYKIATELAWDYQSCRYLGRYPRLRNSSKEFMGEWRSGDEIRNRYLSGQTGIESRIHQSPAALSHATLKEPECLEFDVHTSTTDPEKVVVVEAFKTAGGHTEHLKTPQVAAVLRDAFPLATEKKAPEYLH